MICRVHWLLHNLSRDFKGAYRLCYNYASHNYMFYRMSGRKLYDIFIVQRTSKRCFRVMYCNTETEEFQYFSCWKSSHTAKRMWYIYKLDEKRRRESAESLENKGVEPKK